MKSNSFLKVMKVDMCSKKGKYFSSLKNKIKIRENTCQDIYKYVWKSLIECWLFPCMLYILKENLHSLFRRSRKWIFTRSSSIHQLKLKYIYAGDHVSRQHHCGMFPLNLTCHPPHGLGMAWYIYIYINTYKFEEVKISGGEFKSGFSSWVEEHSKIKRALWKKSSSQVSQLLSPLYI